MGKPKSLHEIMNGTPSDDTGSDDYEQSCKKIEGVPSPSGVPAPTAGELILKEHLDQMNTILQNVFKELKNTRTGKVTGAEGIEGEGMWYVTGEVPVQVATPNPPLGSIIDPERIAFDTLTNTFGPNCPGGPNCSGYQRERVHDALKVRNAPRCTVINDGDTNIYVISSINGRKWMPETPILPYEARTFFNVWELRIRCPKEGNQTAFNATGALKGGWYRVTEFDYWLSYSRIVTIGPPNVSINLTPQELSTLTNTIQPASGVPILGAALIPLNTPTTFRVDVAMSNIGTFNAIVTNSISGATSTVSFNASAGFLLAANGVYEFDLLVNTGDTVNFSYTYVGAPGQILLLRVQEVDAAAGS